MLIQTAVTALIYLAFQQPPQPDVHFGVYFGKNEIGHIQVTKFKRDGLSHYKVESDVEYDSWLYDYQRKSHINARFRVDGLVYCESKVYEDGELEDHKETSRQKSNIYKCYSKKYDSFLIRENIPISCASLYLNEPTQADKVYSENYQKLLTIKTVQNHVYEVEFPDNNVNRYFYDEGKLEKVEVERRWFTIEFIRKN